MILDVNLFGNPVNALFMVSGYLTHTPEIDCGVSFADEDNSYFASVQNGEELMNIAFFGDSGTDISEYFVKIPADILEKWILPLCELNKSFNISCNSDVIVNFNNVTKSVTVNMNSMFIGISSLVDMLIHCEYTGSIDSPLVKSITFNYISDNFFKLSKKGDQFCLSGFLYNGLDMNLSYYVENDTKFDNSDFVSVSTSKCFTLKHKKSRLWYKNVDKLSAALNSLQKSIIFERSDNKVANEFVEAVIFSLSQI